MTELTLVEALQRGISAHRSGNIEEADRFYTAVLKVQPDHPDANHNMGVITVSLNKLDQALPFFKKALDVKPGVAQYWLSYIDTLIKLKRFEKARAVLKQAQEYGAKGNNFDKLENRLVTEQRNTGIMSFKSIAVSQKKVGAKTETLHELIEYIDELREKNELDKAIKVGFDSLERHQAEASLIATIAHCFIIKNNTTEALHLLNELK